MDSIKGGKDSNIVQEVLLRLLLQKTCLRSSCLLSLPVQTYVTSPSSSSMLPVLCLPPPLPLDPVDGEADVADVDVLAEGQKDGVVVGGPG